MKKMAVFAVIALAAACRKDEQAAAPPTPAASAPTATYADAPPSAAPFVPTMVAPPPGTLAATVVNPATIADPVAREAYAKAREVADRLDHMYCYCHCHEHMGHKSLLTCYQGDHAAECGICQKEALMAWDDWKNGLPVEATQRAADFRYNKGEPPPRD